VSRIDAHGDRRARAAVPRHRAHGVHLGRSHRGRFSAKEQRLIARLSTPARVQRYLNELPYNQETAGETLRCFRGVVREGTAHCLEAAIFAAAVLEQHGYPPLLLRLAAGDYLDHVLWVYRREGRWGAVARSRDPGLHGRKPLFRTLRDLALTYVDAYVDATAWIIGYCRLDLRDLAPYDWRLASGNVWKVERDILALRLRRIRTSRRRIAELRRRFFAFKERYPDEKPLYFRGQERWTPLPHQYARARRIGRRLLLSGA